MSLRRKGSRPITVAGDLYRWSVRDRPTYAQAVGQSHISVAVECVNAPQAILHIVLPTLRKDNWLLLPGYIVKPNDLARWIPKALATGWKPGDPGSAFELVLSESDLNEEQQLGRRLGGER